MNTTVFWNVAPCIMVEVQRRFRGVALIIRETMIEAEFWEMHYRTGNPIILRENYLC